jgi:hypothetical protein
VLTPIILTTQETEIRRISIQSQPRQIVLETLSQKNPSHKGAGGVALVCLPRKHEALTSNPDTTKKKKKDGVEKTFLPRLASYHNPSDLSLPSS